MTDREIREAVERGCDSMATLQRELKVATCCGKCRPCAHAVLADCLAETRWPGELATAAT